jgi:hypothetical protein
MITIRKLGLVIASAALAAGGFAAAAGPASAATPPRLSVYLEACGTGSSAVWNASGNPVLTIGQAPAGTCGAQPGSTYDPAYAKVVFVVMGSSVPVIEPAFKTDNYASGSPRMVIELYNGHTLSGYPGLTLSGGTGPDAAGMAWAVDNGTTYTDYATAYKAANANVTAIQDAFIFQDAGQAAGTKDTLTAIQFDGAGFQQRLSNVVVIKNRHSGRCLNEGAGVLSQYACNVAGTYASLRWQVATFADGSKYLESIATHQFVTDGTKGQQLSLTSTPSRFSPTPGGFFWFPKDLVMDVKAMSLVNFAQVIGWPVNGQDNQQWDFANAPA